MSDKNSESAKPKFGAGHVAAMGRLGLSEIRNAVSLSMEHAEAPTEPGLYGTVTPSEVVAQKNEDLQPSSPSPPENQASVLKGRVNEPGRSQESRDGPKKEPPSMDRE